MARPPKAAPAADAVSRLNRLLSKVMSGLNPPENLTVSQWAEKYRVLSSESSAEPGYWRNSRTKYLVDVMDAFNDPKVKHIVMVAASQIGKSECINNIIGYIIHQDPGSILFIQPTIVDAKEYSKLRIGPMLRDCAVLRKQTGTSKTTDSYNSVLQKTYPGGILTLTGSTEAHALASKPIRYVLGDERDRWAASAGTEGDPWSLAMARQKTFYNAKAVEVSTPTIKGSSNIEKSYARGTMERWKTKCPHCGNYHEIQWKDIRFEYQENVVQNEVTYNVTSVEYLCPSCGCLSDEMTMKRQPARWEADNPSALENGVRSFWLNAFVSQWESWKDIVLQFLDAKGDSKKLQVVFNTCFGQLWENRGDMETEEGVMARREDYGAKEDGSPIELPEGVLVVTAGVDTQDDRMEYELVGHSYFGETWGLEKGVIMGRPDSDEVWDALDKIVFLRQLHFADGIPMRVARSFVDEGGHFTQEVRQRCRERQRHNVFAIKGMAGSDRPYTAPPKKQKIMINKRYIGDCWQYQIGVDAGKQLIMDNLKVKTPGPRYCHFPRRDDYGPAYFNGLMSEHLVYDPNKKQQWRWEKLPGHERNEPLDVRNYANAAYKTLLVNLDAIAASLRRQRGMTSPRQLIRDEKPDQSAAHPPEAPPRATAPPPQPRQPLRQKSRRRVSTNKYFEEW